MSKILEATCVGGVVTSQGVPVPSTTILSEGVGSSSGVLIIDEADTTYIAKTSPDLSTTLTKLISVLTQLTTALTAIDAKPTGGAGSAVTPVAAASIAQITVLQGELTTLQGVLK